MSRPLGAVSQSSTVDDVPRRQQHATPQISPTHAPSSMHRFREEGVSAYPVSLPPLRQLSSTPPTPTSERRPGNLHSILNPQNALAEQQRARRRSASQMESPSPVDTQLPPSLPSISRPTSVDSTQGDIAPPPPFQPPPSRTHGRHLQRSPRSPNLHRTQSLGVLNPPTGTIDAHQSPFLSPSFRPAGSEAVTSQPLPTPPVGLRPGYFPPGPPTAPTPPPGINPLRDIRRQSQNFPQSGSASPITSYSPYSQPASVSSSQFDNSSQQGSYMTVANGQQAHDHGNPPITMETERNMIPMAPHGQSSIQFMTIESRQGHQVQIPVDVQAASKLADEKRKRNAGASARFRARRKEKEREASMSIARLEQQLRNTAEDVEHYRSERDYFRSVVFRQPGAEQHHPRPSSPRLRRTSVAPSISSSGRGGRSGSPYSAYSDSPEARDSERNVRRRTSSYHPPSGSVHSQMNGAHTQQQPYTPASFPAMNPPPQARTPLPPPPPHQSFEHRDIRTVSESHMAASHGPGFRNPFATEPGRYDQRGWAPGPPRDNRA